MSTVALDTLQTAAAMYTTVVDPELTRPLLQLLPDAGELSWVRGGEGLVGWGEAARLEVHGPDALAEAADWWAAHCAAADVDDPLRIPGSGPVAFASIAFDPTRGTSVLVVPEVVVGRRDGLTWMTVADGADPQLPTAAPRVDPVGWLRYADGALGPVAWCAAVAAAVDRISTGELQKVVLARDLIVTADAPLDRRRLLLRLAERFPGCWTFAVDGLLGATPELLLRRAGRELSSRVLAGTVARGAGAEDDRLAASLVGSDKDRAEHRYAVDSLVDALRPYCDELSAPAEPELLTLPNVRHLASDVRGTQRRRGRYADATLLELIGAVHPTAAVCGTPTDRAAIVIDELEGMDRGRYAGPVGWLDGRGDGEFGLALRCAELTGPQARLFAGCGIVAGSEPAAELAETQAKFAAFQGALED